MHFLGLCRFCILCIISLNAGVGIEGLNHDKRDAVLQGALPRDEDSSAQQQDGAAPGAEAEQQAVAPDEDAPDQDAQVEAARKAERERRAAKAQVLEWRILNSNYS